VSKRINQIPMACELNGEPKHKGPTCQSSYGSILNSEPSSFEGKQMNSIGNLVHVSPRLASDTVYSAPRSLELRKKGQKNMCLINPYKWTPHIDLSLTSRPHLPFSPILSALSPSSTKPKENPLTQWTLLLRFSPTTAKRGKAGTT
jgi:hypothetical protein